MYKVARYVLLLISIHHLFVDQYNLVEVNIRREKNRFVLLEEVPRKQTRSLENGEQFTVISSLMIDDATKEFSRHITTSVTAIHII